MASIAVAVDWINGQSSDSKLAKKVVELLNNAGHTATYVGWGPNTIQAYARSHECDIMVQIAGGKCFGTLGDFYYGIGSWYKAKGGGFMYYNCWSETWTCHREPRDTFSWGLDLTRWQGKTLPWTFNDMKNVQGKKLYYGYGNSAEELVKTFLANMGGSTNTSTAETTQQNQSSSILDCIKEVISDWDPYGVELYLDGDTVNIKKTNMNTATPLTTARIINNSETFQDYDVSTPNTYGSIKDKFLIDRFGEKSFDDSELTTSGTDAKTLLQMAQRGHGHSIDLKCVLNEDHKETKWVKLSHEQFGITDRYYYITRSSMEEERVMSLTLEPGPPSRYVEVTEVVEETTDDEGTDDDTDDTGDD